MTTTKMDSSLNAFFALLRAGLWEKEVRLSAFTNLDLKEVYRLAKEQTVIGLVAAGLEHASDVKAPKETALHYIQDTVHLEQRNKAMNQFISELIGRLNNQGIESLLVKGQGIAQCYERPLWRAAGDVDLFLDDANYEKAKAYFSDIASSMEQEGEYTKHIGMSISLWEVELHGSMRADVTFKMDRVIDSVQKGTFENHRVRIWNNNGVDVLLPCADDDVFYVFTHILHHFYRGGIGLRQVCDWCRLLHVNNGQIDKNLLLERLIAAAIMPEWQLFGAFAVKYLGMPEASMPFYEVPSKKDLRRIELIKDFILETGNFGHNRDHSYYRKYPFIIRKLISLWRKGGDIIHHYLIFPASSFRYFFRFLSVGLISAAKGRG